MMRNWRLFLAAAFLVLGIIHCCLGHWALGTADITLAFAWLGLFVLRKALAK